MAEYRRSEIVSGVFILIAVAAFGLFAFKVGGLKLPFFETKGTRCVTFFPDAMSLNVGAKVAVGGRRVGEVLGIFLASSEDKELKDHMARWPERLLRAKENRVVVRVEFTVWDNESLSIDPSAAEVVLGQDGFLGTHFLKLDPGVARTHGLKSGTTNEPYLVQTGGPTGIDALLDQGKALMNSLENTLRKVEQRVLSEKNLDDFDQILSGLKSGVGEAEKFIKSLQSLVQPGTPEGVHQKIIDPLNQLITSAERNMNDLTRHLLDVTLKAADKMFQEGTTTLTAAQDAIRRLQLVIDETNPKLQKIIDDLVIVSGGLTGRLDALQKEVIALLNEGQGLIAEARPELIETMQSLRRAMWEAEIAMRKVRANPAVVLFGDDEAVLDAMPADASTIVPSGRVRPFGQREENDDRK